MKYRELGRSGINGSVIALGTWAVGGWMWGGTDRNQAVAAIRAAVDSGITFIDTAPVYGFGIAEETVAEAIKGKRDHVVIATKCGLVWSGNKGEYFFNTDDDFARKDARRKVYKYLAPDSIRRELEESLRRLGTDYIDLYQTHWQDSTTPIAETMNTLMKLKEEGKIRAIGACNAKTGQLDQYRKSGIIDSDQEKYSMFERKQDKSNLPYCKRNFISYLAYSPLELGLLTGKVTPETIFPENDLRTVSPKFSAESLSSVQDMIKEFSPFAEQHGVSISQLVLAWTVHQPGCTHALAGARKPEHARENAKAGDVVLSDEDVAILDGIISRYAPKIGKKR